ncbi:MAG: discoidin domain-containing protein [Nanoarchaeota archaeon]|nr:discoidin domain-containing protein [Nanoarchaeota archaeon]
MRHLSYFVLVLFSFLMLTSFVIAQSPELNRDICRQYFELSPEKAKASSTLKGYPASSAIDSDINTRWFGSAEEPYPKWIQFDLNSNRCVNSADLAFFFRDTPLIFKLEISEDGKSWTSLSDDVSLKEGEDLAKVGFFPKIGRYVRLSELAGKREYGSLSEVKLSSSALRSADGNKISLIVLDENKNSIIKNVGVNLKEESKLIESKNTNSQGQILFTDLSSKEHTLEVLCPINKSTSNNLLFSTFSPLIKSFLSIARTTGYASSGINSGYGVICSGYTFFDNLLCGDIIEPPIVERPFFNYSVFQDPLLFCGDYAVGSPEKAKASSTLSGYPASNSIDSNYSSHWFGETSETYPKWIQFDLGERQCMNGAELAINALDVPTNILLQVSDDSQNWKDVSSQLSITEDFPSTILFNETQGRYLRVLETSGNRNFGSLSEIKINKAKIVSEASIVQSSEGIIENKINPSIIISTKDVSSSVGLSGLETVVFNNETDSYGKKETDNIGSTIFVNALSKDTIIRVYCPSA